MVFRSIESARSSVKDGEPPRWTDETGRLMPQEKESSHRARAGVCTERSGVSLSGS
jgi:hypothetical protein